MAKKQLHERSQKLREKKQLHERFQKLAGIKSISTLKEEDIKEQFANRINADPLLKEDIFTAMAGMAALFGTAGITAQLEVMMDDPEFQVKYLKAADALQKIFGFMRTIGGAVGKGIK